VFSLQDIRKRYPQFGSRRLVEWQQKGYLKKLKRGFYCFESRERSESFHYIVANKIYTPSYISLESALSYYSLIPEGVFLTTSVTTKNTAQYVTAVGDFTYRHIKQGLYFGYKLLNYDNYTVRIAEPEKVILDYLYLNKLNSEDEVEGMRLNKFVVDDIIDFEKLSKYQSVFNSSVLNRRIRMFLNINNA
jgi:predicted transcriptional regulator of viral defense system